MYIITENINSKGLGLYQVVRECYKTPTTLNSCEQENLCITCTDVTVAQCTDQRPDRVDAGPFSVFAPCKKTNRF
jgi:hypothetical protein